ncbi:hypothetical protein A943_09395 [Bacillus sp. CPSM8]|jgi:hypothetical protein|nr:hypothetical protein A943_09395 [Bacillus sp. CPSM8]KUL13925.1 hypothetical protein LI7559_04700 [Bacillus licheniformis LMG 7559]KUL18977.1 hypothetical protein LI6934_03440 [Bacillus licheniformis LMG 6934]
MEAPSSILQKAAETGGLLARLSVFPSLPFDRLKFLW